MISEIVPLTWAAGVCGRRVHFDEDIDRSSILHIGKKGKVFRFSGSLVQGQGGTVEGIAASFGARRRPDSLALAVIDLQSPGNHECEKELPVTSTRGNSKYL